MPRKKTAQNCTVVPWLSGNVDCKDGRFIQCGNSLFLSDKFQALSTGARWLYLCMSMECGGRSTFTFSKAAALKFGIPERSLRRQIDELIGAGFIVVEVCGWRERKENQYRFLFSWKQRGPP